MKYEIRAPRRAVAGETFDVQITYRGNDGELFERTTIKALLAAKSIDTQYSVTLKPASRGRLSATVLLREAGDWTLMVSDDINFIVAAKRILIVPDSPARIRIVDLPDPRAEPPFHRVTLRVRLEDKFGNALDPKRLTAMADATPLEIQVFDDEARVLIRDTGANRVGLTLATRGSNISKQVAVNFRPAWFSMPLFVAERSSFETPLYVSKSFKKRGGLTRVTIDFEPKRCSFEGFEKCDALVSLKESPRKLIATIDSSRIDRIPVSGLQIGTFLWKCKREGETGFRITASDSGTGLFQKTAQKAPVTTCICVNVIWLKGDDAAGKCGVDGANRFAELVSAKENRAQCCPKLTIQLHRSLVYGTEFNKIKQYMDRSLGGKYNFEWKLKLPPKDYGSIESDTLEIALEFAGLWKRNCINIIMIGLPNESPCDSFHKRGSGRIVADATKIGNDPNIIPHEIGHALGLKDNEADAQQLMFHKKPPGTKITPRQCEKIRQTALSGKYKCVN